jgi:hypothetical protein
MARRAPTPREQIGAPLLALGATKLLLRAYENYRFWHGARTGDGKLREVAERRDFWQSRDWYAQGGYIPYRASVPGTRAFLSGEEITNLQRAYAKGEI